MAKDKVEIFLIIIDTEKGKSNAEEWIIVSEDTLLHRGSWFHNIESWVAGFLEALRLTDHEVILKHRWVYDDEIYYNSEINLEEIAEKLEKRPRYTNRLFKVEIPGFS